MSYPRKSVVRLSLAFLIALSFNLRAEEALARPVAECIHAGSQVDISLPASGVASDPISAVALEVHGFALNKKSFVSLSDALEKQGISSEAIDVPGFGTKSASVLDFDVASAEIIDRLKSIHINNPGKKVFLVGESMGGALALSVASKRPDLVDGVIASEPAYKVTVNPVVYPVVFFNLIFRPDAPIKIPTGFAKRVTTCGPFLSRLEQEIRQQRGYSARELWRFRALMKQVPKDVQKLAHTPILFLQGDADRLVRPSGTFKLSKLATETKHDLVSFRNRGHLLLEEQQADTSVVSSIYQWISSNFSNGAKVAEKETIGSAQLITFASAATNKK